MIKGKRKRRFGRHVAVGAFDMGIVPIVGAAGQMNLSPPGFGLKRAVGSIISSARMRRLRETNFGEAIFVKSPLPGRPKIPREAPIVRMAEPILSV